MEEVEEDVFLLAAYALLLCGSYIIATSRDRTVWARQWISRRPQLGFYNGLMQELITEDPETFHSCFRMNKAAFDKLLEIVGPWIKKKDTNWRSAIAPGERLAATLKFLASGIFVKIFFCNYYK